LRDKAGEENRDLVGRIATARAVLALTRYQADTMLNQAQRALEHLSPDSVVSRSSAYWVLGNAHLLVGDRAQARHALSEAIAIGQGAGNTFTTILATIGLGNVQEGDNQLYLASETYQRVLRLAGDQPLQYVSEAHLGLARVLYEWNDLAAAEEHTEQGLQLAREYDRVIDRFVSSEVFLARVKLAQADVAGACALLAEADLAVRKHGFVRRIPEVVAAKVLAYLHQGNRAAAAQLARTHDLPLSQARVHLAQGDARAALTVLGPWRQQVDENEWEDEKLRVAILEALAYHVLGKRAEAFQSLAGALAMAEPGGFVRIFLDEGPPMARLLSEGATRGIMPAYVGRLLKAFENEQRTSEGQPSLSSPQPLPEPLTEREFEVLRLVAEGLSNREIGERLFVALDTVKGHNRRIFGKLQVHRRTEAVARARELGLL
jgi:LuxR family maltose regulon positive regulatory protein